METHEKRMNKINEFFDNLTIEEFENLADECGINEIKPCSESNMELKPLSDADEVEKKDIVIMK